MGRLLALNDPNLHRRIVVLLVQLRREEGGRRLLIRRRLVALPEIDDVLCLLGPWSRVLVENDVGIPAVELTDRVSGNLLLVPLALLPFDPPYRQLAGAIIDRLVSRFLLRDQRPHVNVSRSLPLHRRSGNSFALRRSERHFSRNSPNAKQVFENLGLRSVGDALYRCCIGFAALFEIPVCDGMPRLTQLSWRLGARPHKYRIPSVDQHHLVLIQICFGELPVLSRRQWLVQFSQAEQLGLR
mmetsp:Transcript_31582/g.69162  ORF Transcript_31582/g.69162 Transcript_31582/m.69162 type:complete len:242 (-) Transcript_31582:762-1487(-)